MKKAAIISLYGNSNYGNKLQNYALQEVLKKNNFNVETIVNIPLLNNKKISSLRKIKYDIKSIYFRIIRGDRKIDVLFHNDKKERKNNFLEFNKYINTTSSIFSFSKLDRFNKYDYYFVGSDQIWNPELGGLSDLDLLTFTDAKKISISASFGISELPESCKKRIKIYLDKFDAISVRECQGQKIINEVLPDKKIEVLIDPTLMLTSNEWDKVIKKPKNHSDGKYILCYFLGGVSFEKRKMIEDFAKNNEYRVIYLLDKDSDYNNAGPSEFLYLEKNASLVLTDSYHSSIFAMLYKVPFIIFDREGIRKNMKSRIETLVDVFKLDDRCYRENTDISDYLKFNYNHVDEILKVKRNEFNKFIEENK